MIYFVCFCICPAPRRRSYRPSGLYEGFSFGVEVPIRPREREREADQLFHHHCCVFRGRSQNRELGACGETYWFQWTVRDLWNDVPPRFHGSTRRRRSEVVIARWWWNLMEWMHRRTHDKRSSLSGRNFLQRENLFVWRHTTFKKACLVGLTRVSDKISWDLLCRKSLNYSTSRF
jgi:hypothetical protein